LQFAALFICHINFYLVANSTHEKSNHLFFSCISISASYAQMEVGYNTADLGAEFQWYKNGNLSGFTWLPMQKLHHSFHATIGYYMAGEPTASFYYNQNNGGLGAGLGYRYYILLRPHGFFYWVQRRIYLPIK
jgi:hypothetical protein